MRLRISRGAGFIVQAVAGPVGFVGIPVSLSRVAERHGWSDGRPGAANLVGVLPLGVGTWLAAWAISSHYRAAPQGWEIGLSPQYLLRGGPYQFSRNPMYVGEAAIWAGWAVLFGSLPVAKGLAVLMAIQAVAVRLEERALHKRWGDAYDAYREGTPRWITLPGVYPHRGRRSPGY
jgi:protein-S-isoprenylcysteine O-methyltransferase Ste14